MLKTFTFSLLFLLFIPFSNSQIISSYELMGEYTIAELVQILDDFGVAPGLFAAEHDVEVYKITYNTINAKGTDMTIATGVAAYPKGYVCNLPIACYAHGTTASKTGVPSYGSSELNIGLLWAGAGYVSALPDYLGLGDSPGMHPYVHAKSQATASIDMIRAAKELGAELGYNIGEDLFLFGYSQGGHAAVATYKEIQENHADEMTVTACVGMSGPYDVAGAQTDFINSGVAYATPGYLPYTFLAYQSVYENLYVNSISEALLEPWATTLPPLFDGTNGMGTINNACEPIPTDMIQPAYQLDFETNPNNPFRLAVEDNTLIHWTPQSPLRMLYCTGDEQVYYMNAIVAKDSFVARGAPDVTAEMLGEGDHGDCVQLCLFRAYFVMDSFKTGPNVLLDLAIATEESTPGANDGSIILTANADAGNLTYEWSTGETTSTISNVGAGDYTVTIMQEDGCEANFIFNFEELLLLPNNNPKTEELNFYPNPANSNVNLNLPQFGEYELEIMDISGKVLLSNIIQGEGNYEVNLSNLNTGIHFIQLRNMKDGQQYVGKLLKQ
ncbi:MAG: pimeloyl-ACP methyl ester carboxylesterase [Maribacter sp.]|jgi:pimeloyl-ACP methyl ester carboxylesterase